MEGPIYVLWFVKPKESWLQLSKEEQKELSQKFSATLEQVGGKEIISCNAWLTFEWSQFGIDEYSNMEAAGKRKELVEQCGLQNYFEVKTTWGRKTL